MKKLFSLGAMLLSSILLFTGCGGSTFSDAVLDVPTIAVTSTSIVKEKLLTAVAADSGRNKPRGENQSPALSWETVEGANYYAVCMLDESANWLHFLVTDITATELEQGTYTEAKTYVGPYPPKGSGAHTYRIEVFAIKKQPNYPLDQIDKKISYSGLVNHLNQVGDHSDNILARGYVTGTYENGDNNMEDTK